MEVGEDVGVGFVSMLGDEFAVNANVEFAVDAGDEGEGANAVADAVEGVAGHPGGAEGVASIVAVFDLDGVFFGVGHGGGSFWGDFLHCFGFEDCWSLKTYARVFWGGTVVAQSFFGLFVFFCGGNEW